jgi:hypothetical protein
MEKYGGGNKNKKPFGDDTKGLSDLDFYGMHYGRSIQKSWLPLRCSPGRTATTDGKNIAVVGHAVRAYARAKGNGFFQTLQNW